MPSFIFQSAKEHIYRGRIDLSADSFELRLVEKEPDSEKVVVAGDLADVGPGDPQAVAKNVSYNANTSAIEMKSGSSVSFPDATSGRTFVGVVVTKTADDPKERFALSYNAFSSPVEASSDPLVVDIPTLLVAK